MEKNDFDLRYSFVTCAIIAFAAFKLPKAAWAVISVAGMMKFMFVGVFAAHFTF
ncbi:MAG: hypothetical protein R2827_09310 [Bdellovibrionales bacterium]